MVRRRTRTSKINNVLAAAASNANRGGGVELLPSALAKGVVAATAAELDQYLASPKRKDCKIDNDLTTNVNSNSSNNCKGGGEKLNKKCSKNKSPSPSKTKSEQRSGRIIGVPLATRSQTRTIDGYLTAARNAKLKQESEEEKTFNTTTTNTLPAKDNATSCITALPYQQYTVAAAAAAPHVSPIKNRHSGNNIEPVFIYDLSEDTSNESEANTEYSDEVGGAIIKAIDFTTHRSSLRDSHSSTHSSSSSSNISTTTTNSSTTENIFLQEPVLTLNVDKLAANQASAITINRTLKTEPIFSSPPTSLATINNALNGRFNQIVSLNVVSRNSFGFECKPPAMLFNEDCVHIPDNDNSSCDSGVAFASSLENAPSFALEVNNANQRASLLNNSRRKPTTPHRIVCPSPIKSAVTRVVSPAAKAIVRSPSGRKIVASKEQQLSPRKTQRVAKTASSKIRRRLNQQKEQTPYDTKTEEKIKIELTHTDVAMQQNGVAKIEPIDDDDIELITDDDPNNDDNHDQEFENLEDILKVEICCGEDLINDYTTSKTILNSSKYPTAQQNTSNNNNNNNNNNIKTSTRIKTGTSNKNQQQQQPKTKFQAAHPLATTNNNGNRELTEFFPVRRSVRKTKTAVKEEMMRNLELAVVEERADGLKIAYFEGKGRGIVADRHFVRGEFVVEYVGDLISVAEASEREKYYALDENAGCYMYYFKHKNQQYCIDATIDTGKLGRLVNHSRNGNLVTKVVVVKQKPHLILVAKDDIMPNEELTYDYGDRSKESLIHHPWLAY